MRDSNSQQTVCRTVALPIELIPRVADAHVRQPLFSCGAVLLSMGVRRDPDAGDSATNLSACFDCLSFVTYSWPVRYLYVIPMCGSSGAACGTGAGASHRIRPVTNTHHSTHPSFRFIHSANKFPNQEPRAQPMRMTGMSYQFSITLVSYAAVSSMPPIRATPSRMR